MKLSVLVCAVLFAALVGCGSSSLPTLMLPQGTFLDWANMQSAEIQTAFDRLVTGDSINVQILFPDRYGANSSRPPAETEETMNLRVLSVFANSGGICKYYTLGRTQNASHESGTACKSKQFTENVWVSTDEWNSIPRNVERAKTTDK